MHDGLSARVARRDALLNEPRDERQDERTECAPRCVSGWATRWTRETGDELRIEMRDGTGARDGLVLGARMVRVTWRLLRMNRLQW